MSTLVLVAVAALGIVVSSPQDAARADTRPAVAASAASAAISARLAQAWKDGTLIDQVRSGKLTEADLAPAMATGLDIAGHHLALTAPTAAEAAEGARIAAHMQRGEGGAGSLARPSSGTPASGKGSASLDPGASSPASGTTGAPSIAESKYWWSNHWFYINGTWFKVLVAATIGVISSTVCTFFGLAGALCIPIAGFIAGAVELLKNTSCARHGVHIDVPYLWRTWC
ncbi:hypothetical protein ACMT9Y_13110 [Clavibacter tessellarius]|uniref:hypothetical protein n=1 Tax=Clavibacter tessellarius TaxID=31965 RepID=UPI0039E9E8DD